MTTYIDKKHRVKKIDDWWIPQWKHGWFIFGYWIRYRLMVAEFAMGAFEMYSESWREVKFKSEKDAIQFVKTAIERGYKGTYYVKFDESYPAGIKNW